MMVKRVGLSPASCHSETRLAGVGLIYFDLGAGVSDALAPVVAELAAT